MPKKKKEEKVVASEPQLKEEKEKVAAIEPKPSEPQLKEEKEKAVASEPIKPGEPQLKEKVENVIKEQIRPNLQSHGGDIELVEVTQEGVVKVRLQGACGHCPGAMATLRYGVEEYLREYIPEVKSVELAR